MPYYSGIHAYGSVLVEAICNAIENSGKWGVNIASDPPSTANRWRRVYRSVAKVNNKHLLFDLAVSVENTGSGVTEPSSFIDIWGLMYSSYNYGLVMGSAHNFVPGTPPAAGAYTNPRRCLLHLHSTTTLAATLNVEWHLIVEDTFIFLVVMYISSPSGRACGFFGTVTPWNDHPDGIGVMLTSSTKANPIGYGVNAFTSIDGPYALVNHNIYQTIPTHAPLSGGTGATLDYERFSIDRKLYLHPILVYARPAAMDLAQLLGSMQNVFATKLKRTLIRDINPNDALVRAVQKDDQRYLLVWPYAAGGVVYQHTNGSWYPSMNGFQYPMLVNGTGANHFVLAVKYSA